MAVKRITTTGYRGSITGMRFLPAGEYNVGELDLSTNTIPREWADHMVAIERATVLDDDAPEPKVSSADTAVKDEAESAAEETADESANDDAPEAAGDEDDSEPAEDDEAEPAEDDDVLTTIAIPTQEVDWDDYLVPDLREMAKAREIEGYSTMKRQELIDAILASEPERQ